MRDAITIPVQVDSVRDFDGLPMTRCTYFCIECDAPSPDWRLGLDEAAIPFLMLGLTGIIWRTVESDRDGRFGHPSQIEELFNQIEAHPTLYVDLNSIWLPNALLGRFEMPRGAILRIGVKLFSHAWSYAEGRISLKEFLHSTHESRKAVHFSEEETHAFEEWAQWQIDEARERYHGYPEKKLKKREQYGHYEYEGGDE